MPSETKILKAYEQMRKIVAMCVDDPRAAQEDIDIELNKLKKLTGGTRG